LPTSCFSAGTRVWSETGKVPIEDICIGDRVLTQNPETGELSYQAVVDRTLRPPTEIVEVTVDGGIQIDCTTGHPMWVSGTGWRMAKELKVGDLLHTVNGPREVLTLQPKGERQAAYNLVVAGNGSYFVSPLGVLVHDNTYRAPTRARVPGDQGQPSL
jgi:intein/homing endonuclease